MMLVETSAAVGALLKIFGLPILAGGVASLLGFMFMWPATGKEALIRIGSAILASTALGPVLVIMLRSWWPGLFQAARDIALLYGIEPAFGFLFIAAPLTVMAGLPAWWVMGACVRWFERRKGHDIGELAHDAAELLKDVRRSL